MEDITMTMAGYAYAYRGSFTGSQLMSRGLDIDLAAHDEPCAAFWIREKTPAKAQVLYTDAVVTRFTETMVRGGLQVNLDGVANGVAHMVVCKRDGVEERDVKLDATGKGIAVFDATTITQRASAPSREALPPTTATFAGRDISTGGAWPGAYGKTASWIASTQTSATSNGFRLSTTGAEQFVWGNDNVTPRVLALPPGHTGEKVAACWTALDELEMRIRPPSAKPYRLSIYLMDYDIRGPSWARALEASVLDADGKVLDVQMVEIPETALGVYLTWNVIGNAKVRIRKTAGCNAAVSGVFIDEVK